MSTPSSPRFSKRDAEHLLDGALVGPQALVDLLRTANSPPTAAELSGEQRALAALRAAHLAPTPTPRSRSMIKSALAAVAAAKVATAAGIAAAAATGGLALAAATGNLPGPLQHAAHSAVGAPDSNHSAGTTPQASSTDTPTRSDSSTDSASDSSSASASDSAHAPNPNLVGLCHAYQAGVGTNPGKALDNPAFTVLITAAGGKADVTSYCTALLATAHPSDSNEPSETHGAPSHHGTPNGGPPSTHPDGPPTGVPGSDESTHSNGGSHGGQPTQLPTPTGS